jgi:hypothetical protein
LIPKITCGWSLPNSEETKSYGQQCLLLAQPAAAHGEPKTATTSRVLGKKYLFDKSRKTPVVPVQIRVSLITYIHLSVYTSTSTWGGFTVKCL